MARELPIPTHARAFVDAFFQDDAPRAQVLVAPPQTGGGSTLLAIVARAVQPTGRGLIIAVNRALVEQFAYRVRELLPDVQAHVMDGPTFREQVSESDVAPFRQPGVYVAPIGLFAGTALNAVLAVDWDIVAFDVAHAMGPEPTAVADAIISSPRAARVFLRADAPWRMQRPSQLPTVEWNADDLRAQDGQPLLRPVSTRLVEYMRTSSEVVLLRDAQTLAEASGHSPVMRAALSSPAALETTLVATRNRMAHGVSELGDESLELSTSREPFDPVGYERILTRLDEVAADAKLDACLRAVGPPAEVTYIVVFAVFIATAQYLHAALERAGHIAFRISGDMTFEDRNAQLAEYRSYGGVLVATSSVLRGIELEADVVVHFDVPSSAREYYSRNARLRLRNSASPLISVLLVDRSEAESLQPEFVRQISRDADPSANAPTTS